MRQMRVSRFITLMPLALWWLSQAQAQQATAPPADSTLEEVIVTAEKRSENIQDAPAAITAFTSSQIAERGIKDVSDLETEVPGLKFGAQAGLTDITLRGVGLNTSTGEIEGGVAVSVDGIYQPHPATGDQGQLDLERVEVLYGPQGTLYGRNATGGAINFITAAPSATYEGFAHAGYANYDTMQLSGKVSGPLAENVRASVVAEYDNQLDGFVKNVDGGPDLDASRKLAARIKAAIDLTSNATLDLSLYEFHQSGREPYDVAAYPANPGLVAVEPRLAGADYTFKPWQTTDNSPSSLDRYNSAGSAILTWNFDKMTFTSKTSYQIVWENYIIDADGASNNYDDFLRRDRLNNFIQELDLSGTFGNVDVLGGLYFMHEDLDLYAAIRFPEGTYFGPPPGYELPFGYILHAKDYAAFVDATWHITDRLRLIGGARYTEDTRTADQDLFGGACVASTTVKGNKVTGRGVLQYDIANEQNVYASVSTGYRQGGVAYSECQDVYAPETITAYEVGYKARVGRTLTFSAAAFYYDYSNLQLNQEKTTNGQLVVYLINVPKATIKGGEIQAVAQPTERLRFDLSGSYLDARYGTFYNTDAQLPYVNLGLQNVSGNHLNYSPPWSGTLGAQVKSPPLGNDGDLTARVEWYATAKYYFREFNIPPYAQGGYAIGNAFLTWNATQQYNVRLWVKNITDRAYVRSLIAQNLVGANLITWNDPRTFGVDLNYRF